MATCESDLSQVATLRRRPDRHLACRWLAQSFCIKLGVRSDFRWKKFVREQFSEQKPTKMTTNIQQGSLLDVLKKKMRQTKEEMERYKDECEEFNKRLQVEIMRREEVSFFMFCHVITNFWEGLGNIYGKWPCVKGCVSFTNNFKYYHLTVFWFWLYSKLLCTCHQYN